MFCESNDPQSTGTLFRAILRTRGALLFTKTGCTSMHPGQIPLLFTLRKEDGKSLRELTEILHVKAPTVTVSIQRLEKQGLVLAKTSEKDKRSKQIFLTEKGWELANSLKDEMERQESLLTKGFTEEEHRQLNVYLNRILENLIAETRGE